MATNRSLKIGINGFGRIGRAIARLLIERDTHQIVHINDTNPDIGNLRYLLQYDTTYGSLKAEFEESDKGLAVNGMFMRVSHHSDIASVDWAASGADVVIESSGVTHNETASQLLAQRNLRVFVTHTAPSADFTLVFGVTEDAYDPKKHRVVSTSICDANACAPVLKVLNQAFGITGGFITTVHPWLSYQNLMDGPSRSQAYPGSIYANYSLGRSSIGSLIPKSTTVMSACERLLPELSGVIKSFSYRVPTSAVSSADLSLILGKETSSDEVLEVFREAKRSYSLAHVMRLTDEPLISVDYLRDPHSAIVDTRWLMVNQGNQIKVVLWYDNEWGYSSRVVDSLDLLSNRS